MEVKVSMPMDVVLDLPVRVRQELVVISQEFAVTDDLWVDFYMPEEG